MISFLNVVVMCYNISLSSQNCDIFLSYQFFGFKIYLLAYIPNKTKSWIL